MVGVLLSQVAEHGTVSYALGDWAPPWGIEYRIDYLSGFMLVIVALVGWTTVARLVRGATLATRANLAARVIESFA